MVRFKPSMGGYEVLLGPQQRPFGHLDRDGFFISEFALSGHTSVQPEDLRRIADAAETVKRGEYLTDSVL